MSCSDLIIQAVSKTRVAGEGGRVRAVSGKEPKLSRPQLRLFQLTAVEDRQRAATPPRERHPLSEWMLWQRGRRDTFRAMLRHAYPLEGQMCPPSSMSSDGLRYDDSRLAGSRPDQLRPQRAAWQWEDPERTAERWPGGGAWVDCSAAAASQRVVVLCRMAALCATDLCLWP